jgi:hypothetical protein
MKLTTILSNYQEFRESYKKIGYSQPTINLNDKRQIELLLNTVITDIILFNDILNIYDYDKKEKEKILNFLNKLNLKHKTFLHILTQRNIDNYYEDASILEDEYNDTQLFESLIQHKIENMSFITESQNFKPKLSSKKQIGEFKIVEINNRQFTLIRETGTKHKLSFVIEDNSLIESIDYIIDSDDIVWWSLEIYQDGEYSDLNDKDVIYCLDNFENLMK